MLLQYLSKVKKCPSFSRREMRAQQQRKQKEKRRLRDGQLQTKGKIEIGREGKGALDDDIVKEEANDGDGYESEEDQAFVDVTYLTDDDDVDEGRRREEEAEERRDQLRRKKSSYKRKKAQRLYGGPREQMVDYWGQ